jgi:DNA-binding phage protein
MDLNQLRLTLRSRKGLRRIAEQAGVPYGTVKRFIYDETPNPRFESVERLRQWVQRHPNP